MTSKTNIVITPTIDTAIYAAGDCVGGLLTLTNAGRYSQRGMLFFLRLLDRLGQNAVFDLLLFAGLPTGTYTDQAPLVATPDGDLLIDAIPIVATDYRLISGTIYLARPAISPPTLIDILKVSSTGTGLYGALKLVSGTPTWSSATALTLRMGIEHQ